MRERTAWVEVLRASAPVRLAVAFWVIGLPALVRPAVAFSVQPPDWGSIQLNLNRLFNRTFH